MKRILLILAALALGATTVQAQVRFETGSTDSVRKKALESGNLVFIDLYATWCGPCRTMERDVFSRRDVGEFMERWFVAAKYDVDRSTDKALSQQYGVRSIPTYLIFDTAGDLLGRIQGASDAETFMDDLRTILDRQKQTRER